MAVTVIQDQVRPTGFTINATSADLSGGGETLLSGTAGKCIHVERVWISAGAEITVTVKAAATVLLGPIYMAANSTTDLIFSRQIQLPASTTLTAIASGAGNVTLIVQGCIK